MRRADSIQWVNVGNGGADHTHNVPVDTGGRCGFLPSVPPGGWARGYLTTLFEMRLRVKPHLPTFLVTKVAKGIDPIMGRCLTTDLATGTGQYGQWVCRGSFRTPMGHTCQPSCSDCVPLAHGLSHNLNMQPIL